MEAITPESSGEANQGGSDTSSNVEKIDILKHPMMAG